MDIYRNEGIEGNQAISLHFLNSSSKQQTASRTLLHFHQSVPVPASYIGERGDPPRPNLRGVLLPTSRQLLKAGEKPALS